MHEKLNVIQSITVLSTPNRTYEVGEEAKDGRVIIEIRQVGSEYENHVHSEFCMYDEDGDLIAIIENCPVIVEYKQIIVDGKALPFSDLNENDFDELPI